MIESISDFYKWLRGHDLPAKVSKGDEFVDFQPSRCDVGKTHFSYRNFYKVTLVLETGKLYYADKWIMIDRPAVLFSNPLVPYAWEAMGAEHGHGCFCYFNEQFIKGGSTDNPLSDTPMFDPKMERVYFLDDSALAIATELFRKIGEEFKSDYVLKADVIRSYLHLLVHEVMKTAPVSRYTPHRNAADRIAELFLTLLDRQFPVDIPDECISLRSPIDYADRLAIHVNHLNRVVKGVTGRTTSELINARIVQEAVQLLQHSSLSISEIGFGLGFEEMSSFSKFLKKHTGIPPIDHRKAREI